jgi:hypothetical protein
MDIWKIVPIALAMTVSFLAAAMGQLIAIKTKFAANETRAMVEFKLILVTVARWVIFGGCAAWLIYQLMHEVELPLPATRSSYLTITLQSLALFNLWMISWTLYLHNMLVDHVGETRKMFFGELHAILAAVETRRDLSRPPTP